MTPTHLVLDIGNVLCRWDGESLLTRCYPDPAERELARSSLLHHEDWIKLDAGLLNVTQAAENASSRSGLSVQSLVALLDALPESLEPFEKTQAAVMEAQARGVPVYILSNMHTHCWAHLLKSHRVFDACRGAIVSCEVKLTKPDRAIYAALTNRFDLDPASCVFVDDMAENVEAARACGWQAEQLLHPSDGPELVRTITSAM